MNESCQAVLLETNEQSRQLIQQALGDLNSRMSTLETEAQQREQELMEKNRLQKAFQVGIPWKSEVQVVIFFNKVSYQFKHGHVRSF